MLSDVLASDFNPRNPSSWMPDKQTDAAQNWSFAEDFGVILATAIILNAGYDINKYICLHTKNVKSKKGWTSYHVILLYIGYTLQYTLNIVYTVCS